MTTVLIDNENVTKASLDFEKLASFIHGPRDADDDLDRMYACLEYINKHEHAVRTCFNLVLNPYVSVKSKWFQDKLGEMFSDKQVVRNIHTSKKKKKGDKIND